MSSETMKKRTKKRLVGGLLLVFIGFWQGLTLFVAFLSFFYIPEYEIVRPMWMLLVSQFLRQTVLIICFAAAIDILRTK